MGLQKEIIKAEVGLNGEATFTSGNKTGSFARGTLALGVPGNIYDATPARIKTIVLPAGGGTIGSFVTGEGVIVNPREYANKGTSGNPLAPTLSLPANSVAEICTFGHVVISAAQYAAISAGMNCRLFEGTIPTKGDSESEDAFAKRLAATLVVVEIDGLKAADDDEE